MTREELDSIFEKYVSPQEPEGYHYGYLSLDDLHNILDEVFSKLKEQLPDDEKIEFECRTPNPPDYKEEYAPLTDKEQGEISGARWIRNFCRELLTIKE